MTSWKKQPLSGTSQRERLTQPSGQLKGRTTPGGLLSGRSTRKESTTANIALNLLGWPGSPTCRTDHTEGGLHFTTSSSEAQESSDESDHDP